MNAKMFSIGQNVVYGIHGVCVIEDIRNTSLSSMMPPQNYYVLKQIKRGSVIYVPCSNESGRYKIRGLLSENEIYAMIEAIKGDRMEWNVNRKERTAAFRDILSQGLSEDLLLMMLCIRERKNEFTDAKKKLSGADNDILTSAENLVIQEFAFVLGIDEDDVLSFIMERLTDTGDESSYVGYETLDA